MASRILMLLHPLIPFLIAVLVLSLLRFFCFAYTFLFSHSNDMFSLRIDLSVALLLASTITTVFGSPQILREADNVARSGQELRARTSLNEGLDVPIAPHSLPLKRLDTKDYAGVNAASLGRRSTPNTGNAASPLYALGPTRGFAIDIKVGQDTYPVFLDTESSNTWLPSPDFKCIDFDHKTVLYALLIPTDLICIL